MKNIDLDDVLEETRKKIKCLSDIIIKDKYSEASIDNIISEIKELAEKLNESDEQIQPIVFVPVGSNSKSKIIKILKNIDNLLRRVSIYERKIRPRIRDKAGNLRNKKVIDGRKLLQYENEALVNVLYRSILFREPCTEEIENALKLLRKTGNEKIDLIYLIIKSNEAKSKNISVRGIRRRKLYLKIKRVILYRY